MYFDIGNLKTVPVNKPGVLFYPVTSHKYETPLTVFVYGGELIDGFFAVALTGKEAFIARRVPKEAGTPGILVPEGDLALELADDRKTCGAIYTPGVLAIDQSGPGFFVKSDYDGFDNEVFVNLATWTMDKSIHRENGIWFDEWRLVSRKNQHTQVLIDRKPPHVARVEPLGV